jgi:hypothetical protein
VPVAQGEGDPVVQEPLVFERKDGQEQVFVDVLQGLAQTKAFRVKRPGNERFELV